MTTLAPDAISLAIIGQLDDMPEEVWVIRRAKGVVLGRANKGPYEGEEALLAYESREGALECMAFNERTRGWKAEGAYPALVSTEKALATAKKIKRCKGVGFHRLNPSTGNYPLVAFRYVR